ncbi:MAG: DUF4288 domain-containing protein [Candidatus Thiodiazotropha sp. (ex Ustalcina ferruginea)]|nr:DUF4288 domain-containing protein [Candidatus Thiodiazotropha sp. (ex Ustalcina ferruginea)]
MYKSERSDSESPLWEERIIMVSALDEIEAEKKAIKFAKKYETTFDATNSVKVTWSFYQVERVFAIDDDIEDGVELFSRFLRNTEALSILTPFDD